jgi:hypothetical protein
LGLIFQAAAGGVIRLKGELALIFRFTIGGLAGLDFAGLWRKLGLIFQIEYAGELRWSGILGTGRAGGFKWGGIPRVRGRLGLIFQIGYGGGFRWGGVPGLRG